MVTHKRSGSALSSYGRLGIMLIGVGALLAVDSITDMRMMYKLWPLLCTVSGIGFIGIYQQRARRESAYIGIGVYLIQFSILALYCNFTSWTQIASLWPFFIGMSGSSMVFGFIFGRRNPAMLLAGLLFLSISTVFFLVFSFNTRLWWSIFILVGGSFFIFDTTRRAR